MHGRKDVITVTQFHELVDEIEIECDFPLAWAPVWANAVTFSFEPYLDTVVAPGGREDWQMIYRF